MAECETCGGLGYCEKTFEMSGIRRACADCAVKPQPPRLVRIKPGDYEYAGYYIRQNLAGLNDKGRWRFGPLPPHTGDKRFITHSHGAPSLRAATGLINFYRRKYGSPFPL